MNIHGQEGGDVDWAFDAGPQQKVAAATDTLW